MSALVGASTRSAVPVVLRPGQTPPRLTVVPAHEHDWRLRDTEDVDGVQVRRFECDGCRGVDFS